MSNDNRPTHHLRVFLEDGVIASELVCSDPVACNPELAPECSVALTYAEWPDDSLAGAPDVEIGRVEVLPSWAGPTDGPELTLTPRPGGEV